MVTIDEKEYNRLKKDADDNRQITKLVIIVLSIILAIICYLGFGNRFVDISIEKYRASTLQEIAISNAENQVRIREIERGNLSFEDYIRWLEATNNSASKNSQK